MASFTGAGKLVNRNACRPTTGRRHSKEILLLHRTAQLGCHNEFGWGSVVCSDDNDLSLQIDKQSAEQIKDCSLPEMIPMQYSAQESELDCLPIGPPPGLELCAVSDSSVGKANFLFLDDTPTAMTTDAMLAGCDRENTSCDSFLSCPDNQCVPSMVTPKSSLHICLADCIDDTSTAASESSPELFPRDLVDGINSHVSPSQKIPEQKVSPTTVPSILEGLNFAPRAPSVPSLAEALAFAPTTSSMNQTRKSSKTPISLEAMAPLTPTMNRTGRAPVSLEAAALATPAMSHLGTMPISLEAMAPATPTMNQGGKATISLEAVAPATPSSQAGKTPISLEVMAPTTPKTNQNGKAAISLEAMLEFSPAGAKQAPGHEGAFKEALWNPPQVSPSMMPMGSVSPWWFASYPDVRSPSNNTSGLLAKNSTGLHNATAFWPTGTWDHSMRANSVAGSADTISRASSGTSEVFQI
eukprot:gnl/MRDRNA2_/MRDRNA2_35245_c0_seq1.p1 gnl/MRDRNA2_/MRDRNA2_35245_c0~~gnl/MRDRNA2_/MRDRNA2_35245_c0_seq1.p1  ORF type:complete len:469 (+),score=84.95 gnl/MRDRNA2_/MRDRNA2_35245_c0_seq1:90-1496(+)